MNDAEKKKDLESIRKFNLVVNRILFPIIAIFSFIGLVSGRLLLISKHGVSDIQGIWARIIGGGILVAIGGYTYWSLGKKQSKRDN